MTVKWKLIYAQKGT